jgi:hypothetical protein
MENGKLSDVRIRIKIHWIYVSSSIFPSIQSLPNLLLIRIQSLLRRPDHNFDAVSLCFLSHTPMDIGIILPEIADISVPRGHETDQGDKFTNEFCSI